MEKTDIILPKFIVKKLELTPHMSSLKEPDYCKRYLVKFYDTESRLLQLKHNNQFEHVMEVYKRYLNVQQERIRVLIEGSVKGTFHPEQKHKDKNKLKLCSSQSDRSSIDMLEEELEEIIKITNPTYDDPITSIIEDLINYVLDLCENKKCPEQCLSLSEKENKGSCSCEQNTNEFFRIFSVCRRWRLRFPCISCASRQGTCFNFFVCFLFA